MNERESNLLRSMRLSGPGFFAWVGLLGAVVLWGAFAYYRQLQHGLAATGMRDQISWGLYISNFVFFIGISHAGTLISAILRVTDSDWRRPITRMAEGITVVALCIGGSMVLIDLGRPDRALNLILYSRIQSPIVWDVLSVSTYLAGCLLYFYLPLIPDLAIVADTVGIGSVRRRIYRALSIGWTGSPAEWHLLEKAISVMAVMIIPLAISVHTVVSWIFAMTMRPGWDSSIFGPYFVVGAIYSGAATVVLAMCILRRILKLEAYLEPLHYRNLGLLLLSFSLLYLYFNVNEYLTVGYKFQGGEKLLLERLFFGEYAPYFWGVQVVGVLLPMLLMIAVLGPRRYRRFTVPGLGVASFLAIVGAWAKRYLIVVPTLSNPFLPIQGLPQDWSHYTPTWVEWSITSAAFAAFLLLYTLLLKAFPVISVWETRPAAPPAPEPAMEPELQTVFGPRTWSHTARPLVLLCVLLAALRVAHAQTAPKPTAIDLTWKALTPSEEPAVEDARNTDVPAITPQLRLFAGAMPNFGGVPKPRALYPAIAISARLLDSGKQPIAYQPVSFVLKTSLGALDFGVRPTDEDGKVALLVRDRRLGLYRVKADYAGDGVHLPSAMETIVNFGARPVPALPEGGVLTEPGFNPAIGLPFLSFYGSMWCVFAYAMGYLMVFRMRRARAASKPTSAGSGHNRP